MLDLKISDDKDKLNIYIEYLENSNLINLIFTSFDIKIHVNFKETSATVEFKEENSKCSAEKKTVYAEIVFGDFLLNKESLKAVKEHAICSDGYFESIYRFQVRKFRSETLKGLLDTKSPIAIKNNSLFSLKCSSCKQSLLNNKEAVLFDVLKMPENDLEELAENFFCHLHDHSHEKNGHHDHDSTSSDLTNELNPLRDVNKLRKSILNRPTVLILNCNHVNASSITTDENLNLSCSKCFHNFGYKVKKRLNDYFIWKSNVLINDENRAFDLLEQLEQGRYLIRTKQAPSNIINLLVVKEGFYFKQIICNLKEIDEIKRIELKLDDRENLVKKVMYQNLESTGNEDEELRRKQLHNDVNITDLCVSNECFSKIVETLNTSNDQLCQSLKESNNFKFAII